MALTNVTSDTAAQTVTLTAEFDAPVERAWQLYADPRQLEQWWNPPGYPLTVTEHDLSIGGLVRAHVTAPDGHEIEAYWRISAVEAPRRMEWEDGFLDDEGEPNQAIPPTTMRLTLAERSGGGTLMTIVVGFRSAEAMQEYLDMDIEAQMGVTFAQADALLSELPLPG
jgi:uncharacterized protein YndB with AHSA1/START domain